ncbi:hypothetical protein, partial [Kitasatospora sp. NPDC057541]|uniref:hypothetical protein n=1 Tax=Kitasatospora sp. NPDC057541 TaxID=3346161 RepID=UPI0036B23F12
GTPTAGGARSDGLTAGRRGCHVRLGDQGFGELGLLGPVDDDLAQVSDAPDGAQIVSAQIEVLVLPSAELGRPQGAGLYNGPAEVAAGERRLATGNPGRCPASSRAC